MVEHRYCDAKECSKGEETTEQRDEITSDQWDVGLGNKIALLLVKVVCAELGISIALALLRFLWQWWWARQIMQLTTERNAQLPEETEMAKWMEPDENKIK